MLQQGLFVGDVCYYYGDQGFNFVPPKYIDPSLGYGYDYDVTNADVILTRMDVKNGRIILPDGMSYEILVLPDRDDIDLDVLKKLEELIKSGATVVGRKPTKTNGLRDYPNRNEEVRKLADNIWGPCDGKKVKEYSYGKGKIIWGQTLRETLLKRSVVPDFNFISKRKDTDLDYIHRRTENEEIYFVRNKKKQWEEVDCIFRIKDKIPEIWMPDTGEMRKNIVYSPVDYGTIVSLRLEPEGALFIVFREKSSDNNVVSVNINKTKLFPISKGIPEELPSIEVLPAENNNVDLVVWKEGKYSIKDKLGKEKTIEIKDIPDKLEIKGPWEVHFPKGWGAPPLKVFPELISWTEDNDSGIKYFSGIATYHKEFDVPSELLKDDVKVILDLGNVKVLADIYVNDKNIGILWKQPFRLDITNFIKEGKNILKVEVANTWSNRIVGDTKVPMIEKYTKTNIKGSEVHPGDRQEPILWKDTPLLESGLLGPVQLITAKKINMKLN
jgi:hypothetical protein